MTDSPKPSAGAVILTPQQSASAATVRTRSQQQLEALLKGMFDRLQDIVYEWADGLPEAEQKPFLEVAQTARRQRGDIETFFSRALAASFSALQPLTASGGGPRAIDFSTLSLVRTEDMDVTVTVDSLVARARLKYAAPLGLLRRRYAHVLPKTEVSEGNMPLDPVCIATAFKDAISPLEIDVQQKIILLRAFQQQVLDYLGGLLEEANEVFISAGVLPDLKVAVASDPAKKPKPAVPKPGEKPAEPARVANTEEIFSFLQGMLGQAGAGVPGGPVAGGQYHGGQYVGGGGIGALPAAAVGGSVAAVPLAPQHISATAVVQSVETPDLVTKLSNIQQFQPRAPLAENDKSPSVEEVRTSIRDNLRSDDDTVEAIKRGDEDVINLISMLFDFILDDDDLPTAMKALIGRLQIPLLKVAIIDKSFFNAESHPARRLLNALAKAGIGWSSRSQGSDVLYTRIEGVVTRILTDFSDDLSLFDELLADFTAFYEQQQKREETVDKRTRETEEGRARAELARAMVQQTLNRRMAGKQLPPVAVRLLQEAWRNVLYINCLKEGTESENWRQAVKVVDAVIWSVLPQPGPEWQARLLSLAPKLVNSLKKGLAGVNYDSLSTDNLLRELASVHAGYGRGETTRLVSVVEARPMDTAPVAGQVAVGEMARAESRDASSVVLPEAETVAPVQENALPEDSEFIAIVNRLNVGSWIEFIDGDKVDRHKLVARIRSVDKLIFANRRGVKVGEMSGMKLAIDLSLGRARLVEDSQLIDRALESMIGSLRTIGAKTPNLQGASA
ncbi:MAG: hypothetical protein K0Q68_2633 [Moraxellaceae bacterium]|jgi:hypothetical protein|nr:hypothetical protein [Moraxellaceae bacterium]